jgi:hypothetical protein
MAFEFQGPIQRHQRFSRARLSGELRVGCQENLDAEVLGGAAEDIHNDPLQAAMQVRIGFVDHQDPGLLVDHEGQELKNLNESCASAEEVVIGVFAIDDPDVLIGAALE